MKGKYQAAFIVPVGAKKILGEGGWEFETPNRLSTQIKGFLIDALKLRFFESYLRIESYVDGNIKMSVILDEQNEIESINFQLNEDALTVLTGVCQHCKIFDGAELFIP